MPDGAVIHAKVIEDFKESDQDLRVIPDKAISVDIRYLNITFQEMFTAYRQKIRQAKIDRKILREHNKSEQRKEGYTKIETFDESINTAVKADQQNP